MKVIIVRQLWPDTHTMSEILVLDEGLITHSNAIHRLDIARTWVGVVQMCVCVCGFRVQKKSVCPFDFDYMIVWLTWVWYVILIGWIWREQVVCYILCGKYAAGKKHTKRLTNEIMHHTFLI